MKPTITYKSRPPMTAKAARNAWDYFQRKTTPGRPLVELFYSPNYHHDGPHWCCEIGMLPNDTMRWAFSKEDLCFAAPASTIRNWAEEGL